MLFWVVFCEIFIAILFLYVILVFSRSQPHWSLTGNSCTMTIILSNLQRVHSDQHLPSSCFRAHHQYCRAGVYISEARPEVSSQTSSPPPVWGSSWSSFRGQDRHGVGGGGGRRRATCPHTLFSGRSQVWHPSTANEIPFLGLEMSPSRKPVD